MSDNYNGGYGTSGRADSPYTRYSRSAGVASYRKRRRQAMVFKGIVFVLLVVIIGGAMLMLSSHVFGDESSESPSEQSSSAQAAMPTVQPTQITFAAVGDIVMNGAVLESGQKSSGAYDFSHLFANLEEELAQYDVRLVNQETNLPGSKFGFGALAPLNAPQELGRAEMNVGFNVILRASDHTLDNSYEGLHNELQWWNSEYKTTPLLGVAEPDPEEHPGLNDYVNNIYMYDKDGFKVAIINHSWGVGEDDQGVVSALTEEKITNDVQKARNEGAHMIVACVHWGDENNIDTTDDEAFFAQVYANNGVDVIIGTHPRVLQRVEVLTNESGHRTVCFYSLGCLISSLQNDNLLGGLAAVTLSRDDMGNCSVSSAVLKPVVTHRANKDQFTTYMFYQYNDDLGRSGWDYTTVEGLNNRCSEILGEGYVPDAREYRVAL